MARTRTTSSAWREYYEQATRVRAAVGDPFVRYRQRMIARERMLLAASAVFIVLMTAAFLALAAG